MEALEERQLLANGLIVAAPINVSRTAGSQTEPTVAVNPTNPLNIVILANDTGDIQLGDPLFYGVTFDGGRTWTRTRLVGQRQRRPDPGLLAMVAGTTFDQFGNLFFTYIEDQIHRPAVAPVLLTSTDGGKTAHDRW